VKAQEVPSKFQLLGGARSTRDLLNIMHDVKQAGAMFRPLAEPWADTSSELAELLAIWVRLQNLSGQPPCAYGRGQGEAKQRGKSLGLGPKLTPAPLPQP
jgi:hypothetical protein